MGGACCVFEAHSRGARVGFSLLSVPVSFFSNVLRVEEPRRVYPPPLTAQATDSKHTLARVAAAPAAFPLPKLMPPSASPTQRLTGAAWMAHCACRTHRVCPGVSSPLFLLPLAVLCKRPRKNDVVLLCLTFQLSFHPHQPPAVSSLAMARLAFALLALFAVSAYAAPDVSFGGREGVGVSANARARVFGARDVSLG